MRAFLKSVWESIKLELHPLFAVAGALTLAQWSDIAGIAASSVALAYTLWRWRKESKQKQIVDAP